MQSLVRSARRAYGRLSQGPLGAVAQSLSKDAFRFTGLRAKPMRRAAANLETRPRWTALSLTPPKEVRSARRAQNDLESSYDRRFAAYDVWSRRRCRALDLVSSVSVCEPRTLAVCVY